MRLRWRGKGRFLLGSTEHYGSLVNAAFDFERYLGTIAADGLSLTRAKCVYRELADSLGGQLGHANTQAPRPEHYLAPWARAPEVGGVGPDGLPRFDLDTWDERFFARLRAFLAGAAERGVVVELVFFGSPHNEVTWRHLPFHPGSNVNGAGAGTARWQDVMTLADPSLVEHQRRLVRKVVAETNGFDNLYYEVCNEPLALDGRGQPAPEALRDWQRMVVQTVRETERPLPRRHLVAVNCHQLLPCRAPDGQGEPPVGLLDDGYYRHDPQVDLLNVHYLSHRAPREGLHHAYAGAHRSPFRLGNTTTFVALRAPAGKPIGFDEDYTGVVHGRVPRPVQNRLEAWEALLAGCATYDHLDFTFTTDDPTGAGAGAIPGGLPRAWLDGRELRRRLGHLAVFAGTLDLAALRPAPLLVQRTPHNAGAVAARVCGAAAQATVYLADSRPQEAGFGSTTLRGLLCLGGLAPGTRFAVRALDPCSGAWTVLPAMDADAGGGLRLQIPPFRADLLLHLEPVGA
jgi:hypothetical protein